MASRRKRKLKTSPAFWSYVLDLLHLYLSPQKTAARLRAIFPKDSAQRISHETSYAYSYGQPRGGLRKELIERERHIVAHQLAARVIQQLCNIVFGTGEQVIEADDIVAVIKQAFTQM